LRFIVYSLFVPIKNGAFPSVIITFELFELDNFIKASILLILMFYKVIWIK